MSGTPGANEPRSRRGPIDRPVLVKIRDLISTEEPFASAELDDYLSPSTLSVELSDGLCDAETARIDVQWTTAND